MGSRTIAWMLTVAAAFGPAAVADDSRPDVILITIDTLRADRLGCYGREGHISPAIDRVAAQGALFERAWSTTNWTKPAMASLFTSLDPLTHLVRRGSLRSEEREVAREEILADELETLAEVLKRAGYRTFGISSNPFLTRETGFAQGFDVFEHSAFADGLVVRDMVVRHLEELREAWPYFAWIHFVDPHEPYLPRDPEELAAAEEEVGCTGDCFGKRFHKRLSRAARAADASVRDRALARMQRLYDEQVRYVDGLVGELLSRLPRAERALVVIASDHGEQFLEHGELGHRKGMFEEEVAVPLIVRLHGRLPAGRRIEVPVSLLDVAPIVAEFVGLDPPEAFAGSSLAALDRAREPFAECAAPENRHIAVWRQGSWKYMVHLSEGWEKLFDLSADPGETTDVAASRPKLLKAMRDRVWARYEEYRERAPQAPTREVDPELLEMLESLGYLGD